MPSRPEVSSWIFSDCGFVLLWLLVMKLAFTRTGAHNWVERTAFWQQAPSLGAAVASQGWPQALGTPWHGSAAVFYQVLRAVMVSDPRSSRQEDPHSGRKHSAPCVLGRPGAVREPHPLRHSTLLRGGVITTFQEKSLCTSFGSPQLQTGMERKRR